MALMAEITKRGDLLILGGDFNTLPPNTHKANRFPDTLSDDTLEEKYDADDYSKELHLLKPMYSLYCAAIPLEEYAKDNDLYFTHTTDKAGFWNRKLDYIFSNGRPGALRNGITHMDTKRGGMETMPLSDHAPITVELMLNEKYWPLSEAEQKEKGAETYNSDTKQKASEKSDRRKRDSRKTQSHTYILRSSKRSSRSSSRRRTKE